MKKNETQKNKGSSKYVSFLEIVFLISTIFIFKGFCILRAISSHFS